MALFSFMAESQDDVDAFDRAVTAVGIKGDITVRKIAGDQFPHRAVQLDVVATLEQLRDCARQVDNNTMLKTLRACSLQDNSLKPDEKVE